jgi:hypothetical protein
MAEGDSDNATVNQCTSTARYGTKAYGSLRRQIAESQRLNGWTPACRRSPAMCRNCTACDSASGSAPCGQCRRRFPRDRRSHKVGVSRQRPPNSYHENLATVGGRDIASPVAEPLYSFAVVLQLSFAVFESAPELTRPEMNCMLMAQHSPEAHCNSLSETPMLQSRSCMRI